jgi:hypothetical protein
MNSRIDRMDIFMHRSTLSQEQKISALVPATCLSLLALVSLSITGSPEQFPVTLGFFSIVIAFIFIMVLIRARP